MIVFFCNKLFLRNWRLFRWYHVIWLTLSCAEGACRYRYFVINNCINIKHDVHTAVPEWALKTCAPACTSLEILFFFKQLERACNYFANTILVHTHQVVLYTLLNIACLLLKSVWFYLDGYETQGRWVLCDVTSTNSVTNFLVGITVLWSSLKVAVWMHNFK